MAWSLNWFAARRVALGVLGLVLVLVAHPTTATADEATLLPVEHFVGPATAGVWIQPLTSEPGRYAEIEVAARAAQPWSEPIEISGVFRSSVMHPRVALELRVTDADGVLMARASLALAAEVGSNPFSFAILPEVLPSGRYEATILAVGNEYQLLADAIVTIQKLDGRELGRALDAVQQAVNALEAHLDSRGGIGQFPYQRMRIETVEQLLPTARRMLSDHSLRRADDAIRYMEETLNSVRATLTFGTDAAGKPDSVTQRPDMTTVTPRHGAFYADDTPVFLMGFAGGLELGQNLPVLSRLGLNHALVALDPDSGLDPRATRFLDDARQANMAVTVHLSTGASRATADQHTLWPDTARMYPSELDPAFASILAQLQRQPAVHAVGLANRPVVRFRGEEARHAFIEYLRGTYPTQYDLNRSWKMRLRAFDEVQIMPASDRIAYQHDWQTFTRLAGARYAAGRIQMAQAEAPSLPMFLTYDGGLLKPGEEGANLDYEALGAYLPVTGVTSRLSAAHERYALDFPGHVLPYAILRSLVPDRPLLDTELRIDLEGVGDAPIAHTIAESLVHAGVWDAAVEGLNGVALWAWSRAVVSETRAEANGALVKQLGALEGLARASLDLNRLAPIVVALQQARADVAILYSFEGLLRPEAAEYTESLRNAYEGVSFGGRPVRFMTERQAAAGELDGVHVLVLPRVRTLTDEAFAAVAEYIENGGIVIRTPNQIPYDGRGHSRRQVIASTLETILVRGLDTPAAYFHAIESAYATGRLPEVPRPSNEYGYLLQGVKSRYVEHDGETYLYLVNLRQNAVATGLNGAYRGGYDLIQGREVTFPTVLKPLDPMLLRLEPGATNRVVIADRPSSQ